MNNLVIKDLVVSVEGKQILKGINLEVKEGEIHALMGPNGNGKSTLLSTIMGNPKFKVESGTIEYNGKNVLEMSVDERSRAGIFLGMQYPSEISGLVNSDFLRSAINARLDKPMPLFKFIKELDEAIDELEMKKDLAHRFLNEGFSGGEKKRNEIVQMKLLKPSLAMLDEIDSGLDVDALKLVANAVNKMHEETNMSMLVVSHYERFYDLIKPTHAHVLVNGKIVESGDYELVKKIDEEGYEWLFEKHNIKVEEENPENKRVMLGSCGAKR